LIAAVASELERDTATRRAEAVPPWTPAVDEDLTWFDVESGTIG
jgi:hypothetical protein